MSAGDGGLEWFILKDQNDVDHFMRGVSGVPPVSLPVLAGYAGVGGSEVRAVFVYPADLKTMLGILKNQSTSAYLEIMRAAELISG